MYFCIKSFFSLSKNKEFILVIKFLFNKYSLKPSPFILLVTKIKLGLTYIISCAAKFNDEQSVEHCAEFIAVWRT